MTPWEIAISTRWAMGPQWLVRIRRAIDLGFKGITIHGEIREPEWEEIAAFLPRRTPAAISLFAPLPRTVRPGAGSPFRIGSLHPQERLDAESQAMKTLEAADRAGAAVVLVPPAPLEEPSTEEVLPLLGTERRPPVWDALRRRRADAARRQLDSYLRTLSRLADQADRYGLALALGIGGLPSELPDIDEARRCLVEFEGAPIFLWPDLLEVSLYRRTGGPGAERLEGELGARVLGVTAEDGDGERRRLSLGAGEVDLEAWRWLKEAPPPRAGAAGEPEGSGACGKSAAAVPPPADALAAARHASEAIHASPLAPPIRIAAIDLAPEVEEEGVLATREALRELLHPLEKEFELFGGG